MAADGPGGPRPGAGLTGAAVGNTTQESGASYILAVATGASGNVFVTGTFRGIVVLGTTRLTSQGYYGLFVVKYVPATNTWAWAQSGGSVSGTDTGNAIAVSGTSVYVAGNLENNRSNGVNSLFFSFNARRKPKIK